MIRATIERSSDRLLVWIEDKGNGFDTLTGTYDVAQLATQSVGPLSLRTRIEELGGKLFLTSARQGTDISLEFPA